MDGDICLHGRAASQRSLQTNVDCRPSLEVERTHRPPQGPDALGLRLLERQCRSARSPSRLPPQRVAPRVRQRVERAVQFIEPMQCMYFFLCVLTYHSHPPVTRPDMQAQPRHASPWRADVGPAWHSLRLALDLAHSLKSPSV